MSTTAPSIDNSSLASSPKPAANTLNYDWSDLAFASKKPLSRLEATFIAAPREISPTRFKQLVKQYLPKGPIILGLAKETHVEGFEDQPQFKMLRIDTIQPVIDRVNTASPKHKIYTLHYFQRETKHVLEKVDFGRILLINGSWKYSFHTQAPYYVIASRRLKYEYVSPFVDETEAKAYEDARWPEIKAACKPAGSDSSTATYTAAEMLALASDIAKCSYDYSFQTGVALGRRVGEQDKVSDPSPRYHLLARTFNRVVPYQTYALHHGASRERHYSPPHDLNHYDTNHAEIELLVHSQKAKLDLTGTTLFINLLPCPMCARMFTATDIAEFVYREDHSDGYAVKLLEQSGKVVRRIVAS